MSQPTRLLLATLALAAAGSFAQAQDAKGDPKEGEKKAAMCLGCHSIPGYQSSFPEVYRVPMIAGQNAGYIVASLAAYKKGERRHPTMRALAISLSDKDMADIAAYYSALKPSSVKTVADTPAAPNAQVAALLQKGACASCHGANYDKPINDVYPKLAGQHADYLYAALRSYGVTNNPNVGRANAIMSAQVKPYTRAELKAMAEYFARLPGSLHTPPQDKFR
jgi:cytochrome c553